MKLNVKNEFKLVLPAINENVDVAIQTLMSFVNTIAVSDIKCSDIKCAVTEAINNVVDHAYVGNNYEWNNIILDARYVDNKLRINISDKGVGIADVKQARTPLYTTSDAEFHSGMGFTVMESFADATYVNSRVGFGTKVKLIFNID